MLNIQVADLLPYLRAASMAQWQNCEYTSVDGVTLKYMV